MGKNFIGMLIFRNRQESQRAKELEALKREVTSSNASVHRTKTSSNTFLGIIVGGGSKSALDGKVDKVDGKALSDENYTTIEKAKLAADPIITVSDTEPVSPNVGDLWIDTSE
jgi:hypothetical protein